MSRNIILYDPDSQVPKYRQIIQSVKWAIERKMLKKGDKIPSINQVCSTYNMSRDTVMLAYNDLKSHGIISSNKGKGYFVDSIDTRHIEKVFLQLDELNSSKEELYNSFHESLNADASIDVFIHQFNYQLFKTQLSECNGKYTSYVIMPAHFDNICHLIQKLPGDRVYILDRLKPELNGYPSVYQDFESDIYENLQKVKAELSKYRRMVFVQAGGKEPAERVTGFKRFCVENKMESRIVRSLSEVRPALYDVFLVPSDRTLVELLKIAHEYEFEIGTKFGIISFNDNILKEVVAGGITTISTDFAQMGKSLAEMVLNRKIRQIKNASRIVIRNSI